MTTINNDNVHEYIERGLIDPKKLKIDLNKTKTTSDNTHRWVSLEYAIKQGYKFSFDYDVKEIQTPYTLPEVTIEAKPKKELIFNITPQQAHQQTHWYDYAVKNFQDTYGLTPRDAAGFLPVIGDVLDINDIGKDLSKGNYRQAAIGAGFLLVPNFIEKPFKYLKNLFWLTKNYNNVGTGLTNKYVRKQFLDLAKSPTVSRNFINTYSRTGEAGLNLKQIKEALPKLQELENTYGIVPKAKFNDWEDVNSQLKTIEDGLENGKFIAESYKNQLQYLKDNNQILYNIAKESPQYLDQIASDLQSGKITNIETYVRNLIDQSNTFLRRMNLRNSEDPAKQFLEIRGKTIGEEKNYAMDVGNKNVVFDPIFGREYGSTAMVYLPKNRKLTGPIETWWSQRFPKFNDHSITINANRPQTNRYGSISNHDIDAVFNMNAILDKNNIPSQYLRSSSHMTFLSPNKGATISDQFEVYPFENQDLRFTLGYKLGGKIKH